MDEQRQDDQLEPTYSSSVPIQEVVLKTCQKQWMIEKGGNKGSGIAVQMAQHHDDDIKVTISVICLYTVCSIWPMNRTLSGANTLGQNGTESNGNEGVLHIPQISKALPSDC